MTDTIASPAAPAPAPSSALDQPIRIPHAPGLDGLRGLAVAAVLVFHAGPPGWLPGGFLGVSLFFTLSGYLITTLVLAEVRRDRGLALASFWARRARRLVPALVLTAVAVIVMAHTLDGLSTDLRADLLGGLTYTSNWVEVARGNSYADLFQSPSPLNHLWSLAIEEQFYVLLPLVAWGLARARPRQLRKRLEVGAIGVVVAGVALSQLVDSPTLAYYGTLNRAPEISIGVLLACRTRVTTERAPGLLNGLGVAAAIVTLAGWRLAHVEDGWIAGGGLAAFAVASALLVRAASRPGPIASALSWRPLRGLGLISYGLYLYHWPIVVWLSPPRFEWAPVPLFVARVALALGLAVLSYRFVEQPLRRGRLELPTRTVLSLAGITLLASVVLAASLVEPPPPPRRALPAPAVVAAASRGTAAAADPAAPTTTPPPPGPPSVVLLGDSIPNFLVRDGGQALDPDAVELVDATLEACDAAAANPPAHTWQGKPVPEPDGCTGWPTQYPPYFPKGVPTDTAILMTGAHAVLDRDIEGSYRGPCDPVARDWYQVDIQGRLRYLARKADHVVLVLPSWATGASRWINPVDYLDRADCVRATMTAAARTAGVPIVDFGAYLCPNGRDACEPLRIEDGVHLDREAAPAALAWVVDQALAARRSAPS